MEEGVEMYNKELNLNGSCKGSRYNQIDLIGSYGIKDNFHVRKLARQEEKDGVIPLLAWVGIILLSIIPVVNVFALIIMACTDINLNIKNFAKGALIIIFILVLLFLLYL
ncbi:MAG: hypothetical protein E6344_06760 [Clostridium sp.]|uniref:hypothetical protein n=1 Tax=Clostridium culturomicium TaxID=1499683 RepID=UPI0018CD6C41|nr:hypothetical protein [Clostridium culturomicium]MDU4888981.1 hypothetical protein [Clostridium sp.]MDU7083375.1 hypothetical protein [Clostridium sp.]